VPEGDTLRRAALQLQVLVGQKVAVETPHPRAAVKQIAPRLDGLVLESVEARGKELFLSFQGGHVLRSHLRMSGRWRVGPAGSVRAGLPWLVLRGDEHEAVLWNGPILELDRPRRAAAPDILAAEPDYDVMVASLRGRPIGEALLDQRLVAGIGNIWRSEALWEARVSPWRDDARDDEIRAVLVAAHQRMTESVAGASRPRAVYRRPGRACRRCGTPIRAAGTRTAYWCPECQRGGTEPKA